MKHKIALIILLSANICSFGQNAKSLLEGFKTPQVNTRPYVWWHWINVNISKEGITNDLEEMSKQGIGGVILFDIGGGGEYPTGKVVFMSPEWDKLFAHTVKEVNRLGLDFGFMNCDAYGTSGGPWVKPDDAMKQITFSKITVKGPVTFSETIPQPATIGNY